MRRGFLVGLGLLLASGVAVAEQAADCGDAAAGEVDECVAAMREGEDPRPQIRVLEHPYDLAGFYRAGGQRYGLYQRAGSRYPLAGYYRGAINPRGYSRFWTSGYAPRNRVSAVVPYAGYDGVPGLDYWNRIGENGDLFLMAPILAPIGPLSDVFFSVEIR
jgi:hypothetical protein